MAPVCLLLTASLLAAPDAPGQATVTLAGRPVTAASHVIVLPPAPTPSEQTAASELQSHLAKITGQTLTITRDAPAGQAWFVIGRSPALDSLGLKIDWAKLGEEGYRLKTAGPHLVLAGNRRGVLYAVYVLLEDYLGCRWYTADCTRTPRTGQLAIPPLDVTQQPLFEYRATDYPNSRPPEFAVRNRLNGPQVNADERWGGKVEYRGFVHTFDALLPPAKHFDQHPEWFSEVGGKRLRDQTQICLTNPEALQEVIRSVRHWLDESPNARIISVSQNDWGNYCTCPRCRQLAADEGSQCGPLLHFVNAVADAIAKDHPNVAIDTLAYQWSRRPPRHLKPRPNVIVRLCSIECEFNRPLDASPFNRTFVDDIRGWHKLCNRLYVWDYVINYAHCVQPFPNLQVLGPNTRFFLLHGVKGVYEEANYFSKGGELAELRTWLMAKLLWNPRFDVNRGIDEFLAAYYGAAARPLRAYLDDVHKLAVSDSKFHLPIYVGPNAPFQQPEALARYGAWFDEAEDAVRTDPVLLHRVQVARLPILYSAIARASNPPYQLNGDELAPLVANRSGGDVTRFEQIARAEGLTRVSEGGSTFDDWLARVRPRTANYSVVTLTGGGLTAAVVPDIGGRLLSLKQGLDERCKVFPAGGGINPAEGGYEEFSQSGYRSPGWREPFVVTARDVHHVELEAALSNGLTLRRTYRLDPDQPVLRVVSSVINTSTTPRQGCLRIHPAYRLGDAATARLRLGPAGAPEQPLTAGVDHETELWFRGQDVPPGVWAVLDPAARQTIISRFKPAQVAVCYFNWTGPDHRVNLELWSPDRLLQPGESLTIEHEVEFGTL